MDGAIIGILQDVLVLLVTVLVGVAIRFIAEKLGTEKMKRVQSQWDVTKELAATAVKATEQAYRGYGGEEKKEIALAYLSRELTQRGIKVSGEDLGNLIEAVLREIKDQFGEQWANVLKEPGDDR